MDFRLGAGAEVGRLGVTTALEIEDTCFAPAVFVVADQQQRPGSELSVVLPVPLRPKNSAVSSSAPIWPSGAVGKRNSNGAWKLNSENADFLRCFTGVSRTGDEDDVAAHVERDRRPRAGAVPLGVGLEDEGKWRMVAAIGAPSACSRSGGCG